MPETATKTATIASEFKDPKLFREAAYIDGQWITASKTFSVDNPATGEIIANVPDLGASETRQAIEAANRAFPAWSKKTAKERADHFAQVVRPAAGESGRPRKADDARAGKAAGRIAWRSRLRRLRFFEWFAEEGKRIYGDTIPQHQADKRIVVIKQPVGVVAAITPWNFPLAMIARKAGPALAAGCTLVIKPAEQTPLSALALAELGERAGVPKGVFNVMTGSPEEIGGELTSNPIVRKLSFTGSTEIGKLLMAQCAGTIKKISLELGGNAPFIVFDDADIDAAIEGATASKYRNTGQTCISTNRFYVQDGIYDAFAAKLTQAVKNLKPASGLETGATQGPLIDNAALAKVESHLADAKSNGAKVLLGGNRHALGGRFFEPTVLADVTPQMLISREETFGPVAPLFRFKTEAEAVSLANDTEFGLAAYFYGRDIARIWRVAEALEYGIVGINTGMISTEVAPFGGMKESGLGREGSKYGIDDYLEIKYLCFGGIC